MRCKAGFVNAASITSCKCQDAAKECPRRSPTKVSVSPRTSRRVMLRQSFLALSTFFTRSLVDTESARAAAETAAGADDSVCKNCSGNGKVPCDLCAGTGFWRALSGSDPRQKYKGVVCPECEGVGTLTCPVCLGTGEGNVRGLLRRRRVEPGPGRILQTN